jgi:hypothetical protein
MTPLDNDDRESRDDDDDGVVPPALKALAEQAAAQQRRFNDALDSPGFRAMMEQATAQQRRLSDALDSPGFRAMMEQAAAQQRRLSDALNSPGFRAMMEQAAAHQRRLSDALNSPGVRAMMEQAAVQQRRIREALGSPALREMMARTAEAFRKWDEDERRLLDLLAPRGWVISPSSSVSDLSDLVALADNEGVDAVEAALLAELTPERCRMIVEGLYDRPSFGMWRSSLDQALTAHEQGLYALSVPIWLIAVDGIFLAELGVDRVFSRVHRKEGEPLRKQLDSGAGGRLLDGLIRVIRVVAQQIPTDGSASPGELRRHAVLHGLDPEYGTEKASVQGVLLLEVLHFQLEMRSTDSETASSTETPS